MPDQSNQPVALARIEAMSHARKRDLRRAIETHCARRDLAPRPNSIATMSRADCIIYCLLNSVYVDGVRF